MGGGEDRIRSDRMTLEVVKRSKESGMSTVGGVFVRGYGTRSCGIDDESGDGGIPILS